MSTTETTEAAEPEEIAVYDDVPKKNKPRFFVAGSTFYAQTEDGEDRKSVV